MTKRIFEETEPDFNPTLKPKQEFSAEAFEVFEDTETEEGEEADLSFEEVVRPNRFWIRVLLSALVRLHKVYSGFGIVIKAMLGLL